MPEPVELVSAIRKALKDLRYGTVQLIVHDGQLVRIERTERIRLSSEELAQTKPAGNPGS